MKTVNINQINELFEISHQLQQEHPRAVIYLYGDLGSGKTTLVQTWLKNAGYQGVAGSPTYQLVNRYRLENGKTVLHADLYRLGGSDELLYLDVDEWAASADWIFIEWPEKGGSLLPSPDLRLTLTFDGKDRLLHIEK